MKRTLTSVAAAALVLGAMAPAAFAATATAAGLTAAGGKTITVDGQALYTGVQAGTAQDAGTTTTYFPIYYLNQALTKAGYVNSYDPSSRTWNIQIPGLDASKVVVDGGVGTGNAAIAINGVVVKKFNAVRNKDLAGGKDAVVTTYFPLYYLGNVLSAAGFTGAWNGTTGTFGLTSNYGDAAALKISGATTVVANGASTDTLTLNAVDANGHVVRNYNGSATVSLTGTSVQFDTTVKGQTNATSNTINFTNGVATVVLKSANAVVGSDTTVNAVSTDIKDANGNLVSTSTTIGTVAQVATSVSVTPTSKSLQDNTPTSEEVDVQVLDQAGQPMLWGSYPLSITVSGNGTLAEGTSNTYTTAFIGNGSTTNQVPVHVSSITGVSGPIVVSATSAGLTAGSATINAATVGDAKAIKLAVASGSSASFTADNGSTGASFDVTSVDANGNTVAGLASYNVTVKDSKGNDAVAAGEISSASVVGSTLTVKGTKAGTYTVTVADPAGILTSATTSVTITAGAAATVALTSPAQSTVNVPQSNPVTTVTAQIEDNYGNAVSESGDKVEFLAAGPSGASYTLNGSKTSNYIVTTNASGQASVTFAVQATPSLSFTIGVDKVNTTTVSGVTDTVNVVGLAPSSLTATTATSGGTTTTYFKSGDSVVYTVTEKDAYGNPYPVADRINVTVPSGMTVVTGLSGNSTNGYYATIDPSTGKASFTLQAGNAGVQTVQFADASAANSNVSASASVTVNADVQSKAVFQNGSGAITSSNPLVVAANQPVAIRLVPADNAGNLAVSATPLYYSLSDAANGGYFTLVQGGAPVTNVTIPGGSTGITLYYVNATASTSAGYFGFTATPVAVPSAPSLTATPGAAGTKTIAVSWSAVTGASSYNVSYSTDGGTTWSSATSQTGTTYTYTGTSGGKSVEFKVTATNYAGTSTAGTATASTPAATLASATVSYSASTVAATGTLAAPTLTGKDQYGNALTPTGGAFTATQKSGTGSGFVVDGTTGAVTTTSATTGDVWTVTYAQGGVTASEDITIS